MFDISLRTVIDPSLNKIGRGLAAQGVTANGVTWTGFAVGILAACAISCHFYIVGLVLLLLSRLCDGLDGAVARSAIGKAQQSDLGGFLDIVLDFAFYGLIPFAFLLADPSNNAVAAGALLLVFYVNGASFLSYALMAEKRGIDDAARGSKSLLYTAGLAEAFETIAVFALFCLFPNYFSVIAYIFAAVVLITTASRFMMAYRAFKAN